MITCTLTGVDFTEVDFVRIAFTGRYGKVIRKIEPADVDENGSVVITLTQEETVKLGAGKITIQGRIKYDDGTVQPTSKVLAKMLDIADKVVI